ncbi:hypothetical protein ZWY2020_008419 [Hordeum vulgare]|nr:hypothetical protein ZWY2020_008419 [Hordeum vulgare]
MDTNADLEELEAQNTELNEFNAVQGPIAVTSRISVQKLCNVFSQFNDFKKQLIRDIGFGGVLAIKTLPKLNLKFSSCLMEKVNPETREILIEDYRAIMFSSQDVSNVFGIPCGAKKISSYPTELSEACAEFKKFAEDMSDKGVHSLKAAEAILVKHLDAESRTLDIDMFKIASVIFVVGHMLCPSSKNEYTTVDYGGALSTTAEISEHNWAELVVEHLLAAVRKLKSDLHTRHSTIHLLGCHLFLHVFVLDNLDLGSLTCRDTSLPRIKIFDYDTIRKMIDSLNISQSGEPTFMLARGHIDGTERNRASPQAICKLYKHINEDQRAAIRDMGTGAFLDIKCGYLHNTLVTWFTRQYHSGRKGFVVPRRGFIPLTEESVHKILGIPRGDIEIKYEVDYNEDEIASSLFPCDGSRPKITITAIINNNNGDASFKKLWLIYIVSTMLAPTTDTRISNKCYPMLTHVDVVAEMDMLEHDPPSFDNFQLKGEFREESHSRFDLFGGPGGFETWMKQNIHPSCSQSDKLKATTVINKFASGVGTLFNQFASGVDTLLTELVQGLTAPATRNTTTSRIKRGTEERESDDTSSEDSA